MGLRLLGNSAIGLAFTNLVAVNFCASPSRGSLGEVGNQIAAVVIWLSFQREIYICSLGR